MGKCKLYLLNLLLYLKNEQLEPFVDDDLCFAATFGDMSMLKQLTREAFLLWRSNSKSRFGPICDSMNSSGARFKQCFRFCKCNEDRARADALANK